MIPDADPACDAALQRWVLAVVILASENSLHLHCKANPVILNRLWGFFPLVGEMQRNWENLRDKGQNTTGDLELS